MQTPSAPAAQFGVPTNVRLREEVARILRAQIIAGVRIPGEIYSIGAVAEEMSVSATPVREAVLDLQNAELVHMVRNKGFRVPVLDEHDLDELVELRLMIEAEAVRKIASAGPTDLSHERGLAETVTKAAESGDVVAFVANDRDFHLTLLDRLGNGRLTRTVGRLRDQSRLYGLQRMVGTPQLTESAHEHLAILDAVEAGDAALTAKLMTQHLKHARGMWAGRDETSHR